jgi:hypothetical protein
LIDVSFTGQKIAAGRDLARGEVGEGDVPAERLDGQARVAVYDSTHMGEYFTMVSSLHVYGIA